MSFESNFIPTAMTKTAYLDSDPDCTVKGIDLDPDCTMERNDLEPGCKEMIRIRIALKKGNDSDPDCTEKGNGLDPDCTEKGNGLDPDCIVKGSQFRSALHCERTNSDPDSIYER